MELSLKGKDVGGPDPAPKPKRLEDEEREKKERKEQKKKRKKENKEKNESDDEAEEILKKLKTGKLCFQQSLSYLFESCFFVCSGSLCNRFSFFLDCDYLSRL